MLERVLLLPEKLDLGEIAQAIVYYGKVEISYQRGQISELVERVGIDAAIRLAESDTISLVYRRSFDAVRTDEKALYPHRFVCIYIAKSAEGSSIKNTQDDIAQAIERRIGRGVVPRRQMQRFTELVKTRDEFPDMISKGALADVVDRSFLERAARIIISAKVNMYPRIDLISATCHSENDMLYLESNIDFDHATSLLRKKSGLDDIKFTPANILAPILGIRAEMLYAGDSRADIWTDDMKSSLLQTKVNSFVRRLEGAKYNLNRFEEIAFSGRSFGEAVESGERNIIDVLEFVDSEDTKRFKRWIQEGPDRGDLLVEYEKSRISPSKLAASLPVKAGKIVLFAGAGAAIESAVGGTGMVGAVAGNIVADAALSVADKMLGSHLRLGWKPNHWVNRSASPFLRG